MADDPSQPDFVGKPLRQTRNGLIAFLGVLIAFIIYVQSILGGDPTHAPMKK